MAVALTKTNGVHTLHGRGSKTVPVTIRLPIEVRDVVLRRINGRRGRWESVNHYCQERLVYDIMRPHEKVRRVK